MNNGNRFKLSGGKTLSNYSFSPFVENNSPRNQNIFNRNLTAASYTINDSSTFLTLLGTRFWDGTASPNPYKASNFLVGFSSEKFTDKFRLGAEFLVSSYAEYSTAGDRKTTTRATAFPGNTRDLVDIASFDGFVEGKLTKSSKLTATLDQKGIGFTSLGNPFHRTDYREIDLKFTQHFHDNKLHGEVYYKRFTNNLYGYADNSQTLRGVGFSLSSSFNAKPNFNVTHLPYQQGNNHSDSLFRSNNQFATTIVTLTHKKTYKTKRFNWMLTYTNAEVEYFRIGNSKKKTQSITAHQTFETFHWRISSDVQFNRVTPTVDTLNFASINVRANYEKRKRNLYVNTRVRKSNSNDIIAQLSLGSSGEIAHGLKLSCEVGLWYYDGYWGLEDFVSQYGRVFVSYQINKKTKVISGSKH